MKNTVTPPLWEIEAQEWLVQPVRRQAKTQTQSPCSKHALSWAALSASCFQDGGYIPASRRGEWGAVGTLSVEWMQRALWALLSPFLILCPVSWVQPMYPALLTGAQSYSLNNLGYFCYLRVKILPRCECSSESAVSPELKPPFLFLLPVSGSTSPYKNSFSTAASQRREKSKGKRPDAPTGDVPMPCVGWGDLFTPLGLSSLIGAKQGQN